MFLYVCICFCSWVSCVGIGIGHPVLYAHLIFYLGSRVLYLGSCLLISPLSPLAMPAAIPNALLEQLAAVSTPLCKLFGTNDGCKAGKKCKLRHDTVSLPDLIAQDSEAN